MATHYVLKKRKNPNLLTLIIPCYNEEKVIPYLKESLKQILPQIPSQVEILLVNDGSSDTTIEELIKWSQEEKRVKILSFARNFGHQIAVTAGMDFALGDAIVIMDADLQDPPEVILEMLAKYRDGYDVVYGKREERVGESFFKLATAWLFYRLMKVLVHKDLPLDSGDFRLISRNCLDAIKLMREKHRFLRGMGAWVGFPQTPVIYKRAARAAGETKYPLRKMLTLAMNAAISFSPLPLRLSLSLGFVIAFVGFVVGLTAVVKAWMHYSGLYPDLVYNPGWATIVALLCIIGGSILISIGILGEYIARIFEEVKGRPLYVVESTFNMEQTKRKK
ncbi:glycosyltransferase [Leptospira ognonensis]|uniref:Glycosyltransferase n=1 Tax=Leptospira ognonensis TaxID=2484945 RepID=A0A4R9K454_9LEPT|nr:glycosyltransferase family 2 protein [Leptospira ognonensis]TGL59740.1 glycosyltransferase [Leptospira ognonensis]